jgi:hypothetical protein
MYDGNKTDIKCFQEEYYTNNPETFDIGLKNHTNVRQCWSAFPESGSLGVTDFKDDYRTRYVRHHPLPTHCPKINYPHTENLLSIQRTYCSYSGEINNKMQPCNRIYYSTVQRWNNKFYYKVASCWLFLLSHITMHGSMNIKFIAHN